jgi:hypothetical protein
MQACSKPEWKFGTDSDVFWVSPFSPGKSSKEDTFVEGAKGGEAVIGVSGAKL